MFKDPYTISSSRRLVESVGEFISVSWMDKIKWKAGEFLF